MRVHLKWAQAANTMIIREREYNTCSTCGDTRLVKDEAYGCDQCQTVIDVAKKGVDYLEITVFHAIDKTDHYRVCGLKCLFAWLLAFKPPKDFTFINMPLISGRVRWREFTRYLRAAPRA